MRAAAGTKTCEGSPQTSPFQDLATLAAYQKISSCQADFKKNNCAELQKSLPQEEQGKISKCDAKDLCKSGLDKDLDFQIGCFKGYGNFVVDILKSLYGAGKSVVTSLQEQNECYGDLNQKKLMYAIYDSNVPSSMQLKIPPDDVLSRMRCTDIQEHLFSAQQEGFRSLSDQWDQAKRLKQPLSPDLKEFALWQGRQTPNQQSPSLILEQKAKDLVQKQVSKLQCFNSDGIGQMVCEAELVIASALIGGEVASGGKLLRLASNLSKESKVADATEAVGASQKVDDFVNSVKSAQRGGSGGMDQKLTSATEKQSILDQAGTMTKEERVEAFEKLTGRQLSQAEADQLWKMHQVGASEGRTYYTYTFADKREKMTVAEETNPETGKPFFTQNEANLAMRNGLTGSTSTPVGTADVAKWYDYYKNAIAKDPSSIGAQKLFGDAAARLGKIDEAKAAYRKAYTLLEEDIKKKGGSLVDSKSAQQALSKMNERQLEDVEVFSAAAGKLDRLQDATYARIRLIDKEVDNANRKIPFGQPKYDIGTEYRSAEAELQSQLKSSNEITRTTAQLRLDALKAAWDRFKKEEAKKMMDLGIR